MKKSDLKNGMGIELRNGMRFIFWSDVFYLDKGGAYFDLRDYEETLENKFTSEYDVMKIYKPFESNPFFERPEYILTEEEKNYLAAVIRPFASEVFYFTKTDGDGGKERIKIVCYDGNCTLLAPMNNKKLFRGLFAGRRYCTKELGL